MLISNADLAADECAQITSQGGALAANKAALPLSPNAQPLGQTINRISVQFTRNFRTAQKLRTTDS